MFDIAIFGRTVWDDWRDVDEFPTNAWVNFGGPGANVAVHLSLLGMRCTLITILGTDSRSAIYRDHLLQCGVDLSSAAVVPGAMPTCEMWLSGRHPHRWTDGQDGLVELGRLSNRISSVAEQAGALYFADFPLGNVNSLPLNSLPVGTTTTFYSAPQLTLFTKQTSIRDLLGFPWDVIFLNRKESEFIQQYCGEELESLSKTAAPKVFVVTHEARPTRVYRRDKQQEFPVSALQCVHGIGGGDAFAAGVVAGLRRGLSLEESIRLGHAEAGVVVSQYGCQSPLLRSSPVPKKDNPPDN